LPRKSEGTFAGYREIDETKGSFGCVGLQPSESFGAAFYVGTDPARSIASVQGHRVEDCFRVADNTPKTAPITANAPVSLG
jgi:hypothetical protein